MCDPGSSARSWRPTTTNRGTWGRRARAPSRLPAVELAGPGPVLEIGAGTGRVELPPAGAGIPMVGLDPSPAMLRRLALKGGGRPHFELLRGDGSRLPFGDGTPGAAFFCQVLHLIPDWRAALREAVRVLRPDGRLLLERRERFDNVRHGRALPAAVAVEHVSLGGLIDRMERGVMPAELSIPPGRERAWA